MTRVNARSTSVTLSQPIGMTMSAELSGTRCYVARDVNLKGRLCRLCSPSEDPLEIFDPPRAVLLDDFEVRLDEACPTAGP